MTESDVVRQLSACGEVVRSHKVDDWAFVTFRDRQDAEKALACDSLPFGVERGKGKKAQKQD